MKHFLKNIILIIQSLLVGSILGCSKSSDQLEVFTKFKAEVYRDMNHSHPLPYRLYRPEAYTQKEKYPLVLYLHSAGPRGTDNVSQIEFGAKRLVSPEVQRLQKSFVLVPQCPEKTQWLNTSFKTTPFTNVKQDEIPESDSMKMIIKIIHELNDEFSIDSQRIYVTGPSMGGSGTWDIITRYPNLFAAAIPVTGVSDPSKAYKIKQLPIWAFHGDLDNISDVGNTRNMVAALKENNSACLYTELKSKGHAIASIVYKDLGLYEWLFKQKRNH